jgi:hypothetical protein
VVITWLAGRGFLLPWSLVGLGVVAACLLALLVPVPNCRTVPETVHVLGGSETALVVICPGPYSGTGAGGGVFVTPP